MKDAKSACGNAQERQREIASIEHEEVHEVVGEFEEAFWHFEDRVIIMLIKYLYAEWK